MNRYPGKFLLDASDLPALSRYLNGNRWLASNEQIKGVAPAGDGNMNYVLRVSTARRTFILKQSRPWVEKYPHIAAPWDRALIEADFYREVSNNPFLQSHMPQLLDFDPDERILLLGDLGPGRDLMSAYNSPKDSIHQRDLEMLVDFLLALHTSYRAPQLATKFHNAAMRRLNHEHIFSLPLQPSSPFDLNAITPGLQSLAQSLKSHDDYVVKVRNLGALYLDPGQGTCLLHGDYFPGSWLRIGNEISVIDPEFAFYGRPEWDLGVMVGHCYLAAQPLAQIQAVTGRYSASAPLDLALTSAFAGVEIMRRLIGVAQLPLRCDIHRKHELLDLSCQLVLETRPV